MNPTISYALFFLTEFKVLWDGDFEGSNPSPRTNLQVNVCITETIYHTVDLKSHLLVFNDYFTFTE
jgi:hypothetical protein